MPRKTPFKSIISWLSEKEKLIFLLATIITGVIVLWPLHNFQHYLAQGDHGRDLYCFKKVLDGSLPYRDFSWLFGPLMPYYYGLCYLIGGISIQSVLIGQTFLILLCGVFVYLICATFLPAALSFVCAFWYWSYRGGEFFYTYNHSGGILAILATLYCVFQYIQKDSRRYVYTGFFIIFLLMLIRLNMGVFLLLALCGSLFLIDYVEKRPDLSLRAQSYFFFALITTTLAAIIYWFLLHDLPDYAVYQSFPYFKIQRTDAAASIYETVQYATHMIVTYFTSTTPQKILGGLLAICILQFFVVIFSKKSAQAEKNRLTLIFGALLIFLIFSSHEYIASGVYYRLFWIFPLIFIIIFYLIGIGSKNISSRIIKLLIAITFFLPALWNIQATRQSIENFKNPFHLLDINGNKIYTLQHPYWFQTVKQAVQFINTNARADEKILVAPLDPLYLFLSGHDSATRQLVFFDHIHINQDQEQKLIGEMQAKDANWAIISNRSVSLESGMGTFGKTYCIKLAKYLDENFEVVATFGDWTNPAGWAWNHGVKILRKK